jgi:hypothetical protein
VLQFQASHSGVNGSTMASATSDEPNSASRKRFFSGHQLMRMMKMMMICVAIDSGNRVVPN